MTRDVRVVKPTTLLVALVLLSHILVSTSIPLVSEDPVTFNTRTYMSRMCSTKLSDYMAVLCSEYGYYEPYSDGEIYYDPGPGIVEECCKKTCTKEQAMQYCKPPPKKTTSIDDTMTLTNESHRLADQSHSYSTSMTDRPSELFSRAKTDNGDGALKRKNRERHRETGVRNSACKQKNDGKKRHHRGRYCRCRNRRLECQGRAGKIAEF